VLLTDSNLGTFSGVSKSLIFVVTGALVSFLVTWLLWFDAIDAELTLTEDERLFTASGYDEFLNRVLSEMFKSLLRLADVDN